MLFEIKGKEHELKLDFKAVKHLNAQYQGGAFEVIGKAISGDLDTFTHVIHAGLMHTGEGYSAKAVDKAIEEAFEAEKIDLQYVMETAQKVVAENFFYKKTVDSLMKKNPEAMAQLKELTE